MTTRFQLSTATIAVLLIANALLSLGAALYLESVWMAEVRRRVSLNLSAADAAYNAQVMATQSFLHAASLDQDLRVALEGGDATVLAGLAERLYEGDFVDFLTILDARGHVLARGRRNASENADLSQLPVVRRAIETGRPASGTIVLSPEQLAAEGDDLVAMARFELQATRGARATADHARRSGLVQAAVVPVLDARGKSVGLLLGGNLLNRRHALVDSIRKAVFEPEAGAASAGGTVTIFCGDLRIATNVMRDGQRAVGTRMSEQVAERVLDQGLRWEGPAAVVDTWYITAYEPLRDPDGKVVGALYVGVPEAPFVQQRRIILAVFLAMVVAATIGSLVLMSLATNWILRPISRVVNMSQRVVAGDLTARVGIRPPGEMGVLCQAVDAMAEAMAEREAQLRVATQRQITRSEQLASIGRLAAGVAHEINNPLTGVLTFAYLLKDKPHMQEEDRADLEIIVRETARAAEIVKSLLDFARERPAHKEPLDINEIVRRTLRLIRNQKLMQHIEIHEHYADDLPVVDGDMNQLQQVVLNLAINACEAMPGGGDLTVITESLADTVRVVVRDTGIGIKPEHVGQIFEPFFSTKPVGKGTGLGLSVSYGIVQQHGGSIEVESNDGLGAEFTVVLPAARAAAALAALGDASPALSGAGAANAARSATSSPTEAQSGPSST